MTMREAGKGDKQRPTDHKAFSDNYDRIFGKNTESIWSEKFVQENPKAAVNAINTLQMLLEDRDETIKELTIGEKNINSILSQR